MWKIQKFRKLCKFWMNLSKKMHLIAEIWYFVLHFRIEFWLEGLPELDIPLSKVVIFSCAQSLDFHWQLIWSEIWAPKWFLRFVEFWRRARVGASPYRTQHTANIHSETRSEAEFFQQSCLKRVTYATSHMKFLFLNI